MIELGRNEPCHCGSGKKYKKCHLAKDEVKAHKELEKAAIKPLTEEQAAAKKDSDKHASHKPEKSWLKNVAGRMGFRPATSPRKAPTGGGSSGSGSGG